MMSAPPEPRLPPSADGSVVLDIGGAVGALVLHAPADLSGREIDLVPLDQGHPTTHSEVRQRRLAGRATHAAVYPRLVAGRYRVAGSSQDVEITGGAVTELWYREAPPAPATASPSTHTRRNHVHR